MSDGPAGWREQFDLVRRRIVAAVVQIVALLLMAAAIGAGVWLLFHFPPWDAFIAVLWLSVNPWVGLGIALTVLVAYSQMRRRAAGGPSRPAFRWPVLPAKSDTPPFDPLYFWAIYVAVRLCHLSAVFVWWFLLPLSYMVAGFILFANAAMLPMILFHWTPQENTLLLVWWGVCVYGLYRIPPLLRRLWRWPNHRLLRFIRFTERVLAYLDAHEPSP